MGFKSDVGSKSSRNSQTGIHPIIVVIFPKNVKFGLKLSLDKVCMSTKLSSTMRKREE